MIYRAYRLNYWGHILDRQELDCATDEEAVRLAAELFGEDPIEVSVEVWLGPRRIARLTGPEAGQ